MTLRRSSDAVKTRVRQQKNDKTANEQRTKKHSREAPVKLGRCPTTTNKQTTKERQTNKKNNKQQQKAINKQQKNLRRRSREAPTLPKNRQQTKNNTKKTTTAKNNKHTTKETSDEARTKLRSKNYQIDVCDCGFDSRLEARLS